MGQSPYGFSDQPFEILFETEQTQSIRWVKIMLDGTFQWSRIRIPSEIGGYNVRIRTAWDLGDYLSGCLAYTEPVAVNLMVNVADKLSQSFNDV
jgi:hypothetical protein